MEDQPITTPNNDPNKLDNKVITNSQLVSPKIKNIPDFQQPINSGSLTCDKYIKIKVNGIEYKVPAVAS